MYCLYSEHHGFHLGYKPSDKDDGAWSNPKPNWQPIGRVLTVFMDEDICITSVNIYNSLKLASTEKTRNEKLIKEYTGEDVVLIITSLEDLIKNRYELYKMFYKNGVK